MTAMVMSTTPNNNSNLHFCSIYYVKYFCMFLKYPNSRRIFTTTLGWCSNSSHSIDEKTVSLRSKLLVQGYKATTWYSSGWDPVTMTLESVLLSTVLYCQNDHLQLHCFEGH